jgi:hypothetical protein
MTALDDSPSAARRCRQLGPPSDGGILFESCDDSPYKSLDYHRSQSGTKDPKSVWSKEISRADECHTFCGAKLNGWRDENGNCWAVAKDEEIGFGTHEERVAFFWEPRNDGDPWHGFPVAGRKGLAFKQKLPDALIEEWYRSGLISFSRKLQMLKGRW